MLCLLLTGGVLIAVMQSSVVLNPGLDLWPFSPLQVQAAPRCRGDDILKSQRSRVLGQVQHNVMDTMLAPKGSPGEFLVARRQSIKLLNEIVMNF